METKQNDYQKTRRQFFVYLILFLGIIILGLYYKTKRGNENIQLDKKGIVTIGTVISIRNSTRGDWIRYSYNVESKLFKDTKNTYQKNIRVGDKYEVEYLPDNPEINRINFDRKISTDK